MAEPTGGPAEPKKPGMDTNMGVDFVVTFRFADSDKTEAAQRFEELVRALGQIGLATEVRNGGSHSLFVFVRVASEEHLFGEVYRSRVRDWLHGVRAAAPPKDTRQALEAEPMHEAERLRIIYQLITNSEAEGGAGITPAEGRWRNVESVFALHDHERNKQWLKKWSTKWFLAPEDLDEIRDRLGERIAYYFAFTQSYFMFLLLPAAVGAAAWLLLGGFSCLYAVVNCFLCVLFTEWWKQQEVDLAVRWGVRNVSSIAARNKDFAHEDMATDPVTGEQVAFFPAAKRVRRQLLELPFAIVAALVLGGLIATCFGIEIFIAEVYDGPLKAVLVFLPTGILTTCMPVLSAALTRFAIRLNHFENYETQAAYETALTQKIFVLNFITSYLPILLTAFVYLPFGSLLVPYLDIFSLTVKPFAQDEAQMQVPQQKGVFEINPRRLRKQVIYFTVTAQVVNLAMEVVVPYLKRKGFAKFKKMQSERAAKSSGAATTTTTEPDHPDEAAFLARVRNEAELAVYDVTTDLREMVVQFGYLTLFSVVWPLTACSFLLNDWLELRADALKICVEMQRPTPWRADSIGPWLDSLAFLAWAGSVSSAALVYMFGGRRDGAGPDGTPDSLRGWALLLAVLGAEHLFFLVRFAVAFAMAKVDSPGRQKERRERYLVRRRYFEESLGQLQRRQQQHVSKEALEEHASHAGGAGGDGVQDRFWARQRTWRESARVGVAMIAETAAADEGAEGKKEL